MSPSAAHRACALALALAAASACAPAARPLSHAPLQVSPTRDTASPFARAVARGTRSWTGVPGPRYWQQWARYRLAATLEPGRARLTGHGAVRYVNHSPDTLRTLAIQLYQNIHAPDAARNEAVPLTGGITLTRVAAQGVELPDLEADTGVGYRVDGTVGWLRLAHPLAPGDSADLEFAWTFQVPPEGAPRMGQDGVVFFLGYWYPQLAVYDDVSGWQTDPYMGNAEFYMGYGDYDVSVTAPEGWLVAATGELENARDVLSPRTRERLAEARHAPEVVHVVRSRDRGAGRATAKGLDGRLTWRFRARNVRDFAFAASRAFLWDATVADVGDRDGDGTPDSVAVYSLYRPNIGTWKESARYVKHGVEFLSRFLWPYPYPHMTAVEGLVSGGMEYPMVTLIGGLLSADELYAVTAHEVGHMWFPMQVGSDEKRYGWQDEGLTSFDEAQGVRDFLKKDAEREAQRAYLASAGDGDEAPLIRHGDEYPSVHAYTVASYAKPAAVFRALRGVLGDSTFLRAYREYGRRWRGKHPQPQDLWNTFNDVSGRDLSWFWRAWFLETWTLDQAVARVRPAGDSAKIVIENRGRAPMPVRLALTRADGSVERLGLPVDVWLSGARRHTLRVRNRPALTRVEIDPEALFPDTRRRNNRWER